MYNIAKDDGLGGTKLLDQPTFSSIQSRTRFQLRTSEPARIYYEVKQIGDVSYPLEKNKDAIIPRSERLLFEQQVLMRPSARFKNHNRLSYCFNAAFTSQDQSYNDGLVVLEGTPPFYLQVSVRNLAASETHLETIELWDTQWRLNLPNYTFRSIGPHQVTIESVRDASHCEQVAPDPLFRSVWVDVAETAAIIPFSRREDYCVGDAIPFQLEGTPPWTIGFRVNGRAHTQEAKLSPWAAPQHAAGEFAITSVAHQQRMCKTAVTDLRYAVHPLPAAQVGHGKRIVQDIHEGDQAEIVFTLIGEPPFTFTYQRAELSPRKGAQGKVLETHTVSGVTTKEYSIFSALEGAYFMSMSMRLVKKVALCLTIVCNRQEPGLLRRSPTDTADIRPRNRTVERSLGDDATVHLTHKISIMFWFVCMQCCRTYYILANIVDSSSLLFAVHEAKECCAVCSLANQKRETMTSSG